MRQDKSLKKWCFNQRHCYLKATKRSLSVITVISKFMKLNFSLNSQLHYSKSIMHKKEVQNCQSNSKDPGVKGFCFLNVGSQEIYINFS